jgi:hypothetical protein
VVMQSRRDAVVVGDEEVVEVMAGQRFVVE